MWEKNRSRIISILLYGTAGILSLWLILKFALPWLLPFILAFLTAKLLEPAIKLLTERFRMKRGFAAAACSLVFLLLIIAIIWFAAGKIFTELTEFTAKLPEILAGIQPLLDGFTARLSGFLPDGWLQKLTEQGSGLVSGILGKLLSFISGCAGCAPDILLFTVTYAVSIFFMSAGFHVISDFLLRQLPEKARRKIPEILSGISGTFGKWLRAQLILMGITFLELTAGLMILHVSYAALFSLLIAFIDALPVFGAGTVLIPWAAYALLTGDSGLCIGLIVLYGAVSTVRNCLQPKIIGSQMGLHPLATLMSMYIGYKAVGVLGMIIFPVILILLKELNGKKYIRLWK